MNEVIKSTSTIVTPIPKNAPALPSRHLQLGDVSQRWSYVDCDGHPVLYVCRFDTGYSDKKGKVNKEFRPLTLWRDNRGKLEWKWQGQEGVRPLYNLQSIAETGVETSVLIVEGEKAADAAQMLLPEMVATTSLNGAGAVAKTDWSPLRGRQCIIAPDCDEPGEKFRDMVIQKLREVGAAEIRLLDMPLIAQAAVSNGTIIAGGTAEVPVGYDIADTYAAGWTHEKFSQFLEAHPKAIYALEVNDDSADDEDLFEDEKALSGVPGWDYECDLTGVYKIEKVFDKKREKWVKTRTWICSKLEIVAFARTEDNEAWGRLVNLSDPDGNEKNVVICSDEFAGFGHGACKRIMSLGLTMVPTTNNRTNVMEYITGSQPERRVRFTTKTGWVGQSFSFPDFSAGKEEAFCDLGEIENRYQRGGSFAEWKELASLAVGNSRLILVISMAFAGPLIQPLQQESGGIHFSGKQGQGKSTGLELGGSVWGGMPGGTYSRPWLGSVAGLEAVASTTNDTFLALDEIGQVRFDLVGEILYWLANGAGNNRASTVGKLLRSAFWNVMIASTGEKTIAQVLSENLRSGQAMGGQLQRMLDLPVDAGCGLGIFENLRGFENGTKFSDHIRAQSKQHYGHAARAYLNHLVPNLEESKHMAEATIDCFVKEVCPSDATEQISRAAKRFGLIAAAGELATCFGILPWPAGEALAASKRCFEDWLKQRGNHQFDQETIDAIAAVQNFISRHGEARFQPLRSKLDDDQNGFYSTIKDRVGFRKLDSTGVKYIILPETFRTEVCGKLNQDLVLKALRGQGLLELGESGRTLKNTRLPDQERVVRCVVLAPGILSWPLQFDDEAEEA